MGLPYFLAVLCLVGFACSAPREPGISRPDLEGALQKPLVEHFEYIAAYNAETGINPPPKELVRSRAPGNICEPKFMVSPAETGDGDGVGKGASLLLPEFFAS